MIEGLKKMLSWNPARRQRHEPWDDPKRPTRELVNVTLAREVSEAARQRLDKAIAHRAKMNDIFDEMLPHHEAEK